MSRNVAAFAAGLVFALGLGLSGMTDANKVIAFLNLAGDWDPSLAFVMVGAIGVHLAFFRWVVNRPSPLFAEAFRIPTTQDITAPLVVGAGLFGVGWGLGGYCPGPALVSTTSLGPSALVFAAAMIVGMALFTLSPRPTALPPGNPAEGAG